MKFNRLSEYLKVIFLWAEFDAPPKRYVEALTPPVPLRRQPNLETGSLKMQLV